MNDFIILHLSDTHIGNPKYNTDSSTVLETLIEDVKFMQGRIGTPQLIVFSGDLAFGELPNISIAEQYEKSYNFISQIYTCLGTSSELTPALFVPGNHDVNRSNVDATQDLWIDELKSDEVLDGEMNKNSVLWRRMLERQKEWQSFYKRLIHSDFSFDDQLNMTTGIMFHSGIRIGIAGLNSSWSCSEKDRKGRIWVGRHQYQLALQRIKESEFKIAVWHHPLSWLNEIEEHSFRGWVSQDSICLCMGMNTTNLSRKKTIISTLQVGPAIKVLREQTPIAGQA